MMYKNENGDHTSRTDTFDEPQCPLHAHKPIRALTAAQRIHLTRGVSLLRTNNSRTTSMSGRTKPGKETIPATAVVWTIYMQTVADGRRKWTNTTTITIQAPSKGCDATDNEQRSGDGRDGKTVRR